MSTDHTGLTALTTNHRGAYYIVHRSKGTYCLAHKSQWGSPYCPQTIVWPTVLRTNHVGETRGPWGLPRCAGVADNAR